jgi:polyisoprenyl-phosphate glycosyltransferase
MNNYHIITPVFNDWRSLNKLLKNIDKYFKKFIGKINIIVINDCSTLKPAIEIKKLKKINKIILINLKSNLGSQKAISVALKYLLIKKTDSIITVIDADGEDDFTQIKKMVGQAIKNKKYIIVSNRTLRKEGLIFKILYKIHLFVTLLLTGRWISFGSFSSFHSGNLKSLLSNKDTWLAYSGAVMKNTKILNLFAARKKRYYDKSKLSLFKLFTHALKISAIFKKRIIANIFFIIFCTYILSYFQVMQPSIFLILLILFLQNVMIITFHLFTNFDDFYNNQKFIKKVSTIKN